MSQSRTSECQWEKLPQSPFKCSPDVVMNFMEGFFLGLKCAQNCGNSNEKIVKKSFSNLGVKLEAYPTFEPLGLLVSRMSKNRENLNGHRCMATGQWPKTISNCCRPFSALFRLFSHFWGCLFLTVFGRPFSHLFAPFACSHLAAAI